MEIDYLAQAEQLDSWEASTALALIDIARSLRTIAAHGTAAEAAVTAVQESEGPAEWARTTRERVSVKPKEEP